MSESFTLIFLINNNDIITTCNYCLFCVGMIIAINEGDISIFPHKIQYFIDFSDGGCDVCRYISGYFILR